MKKYLGRIFDEKTKTWAFPDGSGRLPDECIKQYRQDVEVLGYPSLFGLLVAATNKEAWKKRIKEISQPPNSEMEK